jgi:hypothetical protein
VALGLCLSVLFGCGDDDGAPPSDSAAGVGDSNAGGQGDVGGGSSRGGDDPSGGGDGAVSDGAAAGSAELGGGGQVATDPFCGDGSIGDDEECEGREGCMPTERCSADCTCQALPASVPSSQELIARALAAGDIDYATSLLYRVWALFQAPELPAAYDGSGGLPEDAYLFLELSRVRAQLPAAIETAIAPYLVRPTEPTSIFSRPPAQLKIAAAQAEVIPPSVGCAFDEIGQPDWRATETTNFVVWSCGGGVSTMDRFASERQVVGNMAEQILDDMFPKLGPILEDSYAFGPGNQKRIDIYLLTLNQCRMREQGCERIKKGMLAAAISARPCGPQGAGGSLVSSAYLIVPTDGVPAAASGEQAAHLHYMLVHEMFHAISYGINIEAQGGTCTPPAQPGAEAPAPQNGALSWLSEASAEWSSFAFASGKWPQRRDDLFNAYQVLRDPRTQGLHATAGQLAYEAWLYPLFVQEENGEEPQVMYDLWNGARNARTPEDLDRRLNQVLPFADNYRKYAVRNFNRELPGDPIPKFHGDTDDALNPGTECAIPEPAPMLPAPLHFSYPLGLAPLSHEYSHYWLDDSVRWFRIDTTPLGGEQVNLDVITKVADEWKHEAVSGPIFEFCRDDEARDISEVYVVFSNADFRRGTDVSGNYEVDTRRTCPGGWSGIIRVRQTFDEYTLVTDPFFSETKTRSDVETQEWAVVESKPYAGPSTPGLEIDRAKMTFRGHMRGSTEIVSTSEQCTQNYTVSEFGSGSSTTFFQFSPAGPGSYVWGPEAAGDSFETSTTTTSITCEGTVSDVQTRAHAQMVGFLALSQGLVMLKEDPDDPGHFHGTANPIHQETSLNGGGNVLDVQVDWDLRRTPDR